MAGDSGVRGRVGDPGGVAAQSVSDAGVPGSEAAGSPRAGALTSIAAGAAEGGGVPWSGEPRGGGTTPKGTVEAFRGWLAGVDVEGLSDRERVDLLGELERVKGSVCAVQARVTDAFRCSREVVAPADVGRSVGSEVALARRESPALGDRFVGLSRALVHEMPVTMAALSSGVCGERHAVAMVAATACLTVEDRAVVDRRVGPLLGRLGVKGAAAAAARVAAELDAASVVRRMEAAVSSRRVGVRPAPDGMAYLSVLGPLKDVVGAHAALQARARSVVSGQCEEEAPGGRGVGAVAADTALRLLSGRATGQVQPVEVHLVMTDRALLGTGDATRSVFEPARIPGYGSVPAPVARAWLREGLDDPPGAAKRGTAGALTARGGTSARGTLFGAGDVPDRATARERDAALGAGGAVGSARAARVWVRRLYTSADGRDLVGMDSRRRLFGGLLRRMLVLRDDVCTTPWCDSLVVHADHTIPARDGGLTDFATGNGRCARCNYTKEAPGWAVRVTRTGLPDDAGPPSRPGAPGAPTSAETAAVAAALPIGGDGPHEIEVTTPTGRTYRSQAPPLTGWGWEPTRPPGGPARRRSRPRERPQKRPRLTSPLERHLVDTLASVG